MAGFQITIKGHGDHGCDRRALPGDRLTRRCRQIDCPQCLTLDFIQELKAKGYQIFETTFVHNAGNVDENVIVEDDLVANTRTKGQFR